jgi:hypothetical protein
MHTCVCSVYMQTRIDTDALPLVLHAYTPTAEHGCQNRVHRGHETGMLNCLNFTISSITTCKGLSHKLVQD